MESHCQVHEEQMQSRRSSSLFKSEQECFCRLGGRAEDVKEPQRKHVSITPLIVIYVSILIVIELKIHVHGARIYRGHTS